MENRFTKTLAVAGTLLVWYPILRALCVSSDFLIDQGELVDDYAYTLQHFSTALLGGLLLIWAASRARRRQKIILWSYLLGVGALILGLTLASVFGLDSDVIRPETYLVAFLSVGFFVLVTVVMAVGGVLLLRDLFRPPINDQRVQP